LSITKFSTPEALKLLRKKLGWTQKRLAQELRKAEGTVKHWEIGIQEPSKEVWEKLGALAPDLDLADYCGKRAGLPAFSGIRLKEPESPPYFKGVPGTVPSAWTSEIGDVRRRSLSEAQEENRLRRLLQKIIDSGHGEAIEAVTKSLEVFAQYVEVIGPKPPAAAPAAQIGDATERTGKQQRRARRAG
jgi:transcriptional regulator with XRE-family HTH domain